MIFASLYRETQALSCHLRSHAIHEEVRYRELLSIKCFEPLISYSLIVRNIKEGQLCAIHEFYKDIILYRILTIAYLKIFKALTTGFKEFQHGFLPDKWTLSDIQSLNFVNIVRNFIKAFVRDLKPAQG